MGPSDPAEGPLERHEIGDATALVTAAGWNQVPADWEIFLSRGHVHALRDGGRVVATAAALPYQGFGWISMVLVAPSHRRRGFATHVLRRCIDDITNAGLVAGLDATPAGRPIYRRLGFEDSWGFRRLVWRARAQPHAAVAAPPGVDVRPLADSDWPQLLARDRPAFGADRAAVLECLRRRLPNAAWVAMRDGRLVGYLLGRDGRVASQLGPVVADSDTIGIALLARALDAVAGPIYVDVPDARLAVRSWLQGIGFTVERPLTRMFLGRAPAVDDLGSMVAVAGPEFG